MEYPEIPAGINTIPVIFIDIAIITLCNDIPNEVEEYGIFQPLLTVVKN